MLITDPVALAPSFTIRSQFQSFPLATYTKFLSSDPTRIGLLLSSGLTGAAQLYVTPVPLGVAVQGIQFVAGSPPVIIAFDQMGGLTQMEWYVSAASAGGPLFWIESLFRPQPSQIYQGE